MRVRQIALVAEKLAPVRESFFKLLGLSSDFADTGVAEFGLENSVMTIGDTYLEIVAPTQPGTTAGRLLERRGGDGGYMVLCQVDEIAKYRERTDQLGVRRIWDADLPDVKAFHMHPKDIGGAIVSLDEMIPVASWRWAGPGWEQRAAKHVGQIIGVSIQADKVDEMVARWSEVLDVTADSRTLVLDDGSWIKFVEGSRVSAEGSHLDAEGFHLDAEGFHLDAEGSLLNAEGSNPQGDGVCEVSFAQCDLDALKRSANTLGLIWVDDSVELGGVRLRFAP